MLSALRGPLALPASTRSPFPHTPSLDSAYVRQFGFAPVVPSTFTSLASPPPPASPLTGRQEEVQVVVCSNKALKINAAHTIFQLNPQFQNCLVQCIGVSASSDIADQPLGVDNGQLGARNRISNAQTQYPRQPNRFFVAIESFFTEPSDDAYPQDHAFVMIENDLGETFEFVSDGVAVHPSVFHLAAESSKGRVATGLNETLGNVLAAQYGLSHDDWQPQITLENLTRSQQIMSSFNPLVHTFW